MPTHKKKFAHQDKLRKNKLSVRSRNFVIIIHFLLIISLLYQIKPAYSRTILVPTDFRTIQEAVNNATAGDTIQVGPGIYYEHVVVTKSLTIIGENPQTTIVDGTANGTVFDLEASNVYITGFTIRNAGNNYNAIASEKELVTNDYHQIIDNILTTSQYGVYLSNSKSNTIFNNTFIKNAFGGIFLNRADNTNITANTIAESAYGIKMLSSLNVIILGNTVSQTSYAVHLTASSTGNTIRRNLISGKTVGVYSSSDDTTVDHNTMTDCAYGIYFYNCRYGSIYYNTFMGNSYGIRLYMPSSGTSSHNINNNKISNTDWALELVNAYGNTFTGNWLQQNTYGIYMSSSGSNTIYHNNFVNNNMQAYAGTGTGNLWDKDGEGNYWSDYQGEDANNDGIGDTPYRIIPGYDNYPLMETWSEHDILIANVTTSTNRTYNGSIVDITVTVKNKGKGGTSETFTVTAEYDSNVVGTKTVTSLAPETTQTLTFNWNTTGVVPEINYTISARASTVPDEFNTENNNLIDGTVQVMKLMGDVDGDGDVDLDDLYYVMIGYDMTIEDAMAVYGVPPGTDIDGDGTVDLDDLYYVLRDSGYP